MVVRVSTLAAVIAVAVIAVPVRAERGPARTRVPIAARVVQQAAAAALTGHIPEEVRVGEVPLALPEATLDHPPVVGRARAEPALAKRGAGPKSCGLGSRCSYNALLSSLVITKDLEIPGAPGMALRLIPTKSALAGEASSPIVLKPRVVGTSWYGLDVAARF